MNQAGKAARFAELHVKGAPLLLYNAWDAGSAKSILDAGAKAIATSSWAVAEAQGYRDGEAIPIGLVEQIVTRITGTVDAPVTVDFEGGYSDDDGVLAENVSRLLELGVIGINFEDRARAPGFMQSTGRLAGSQPLMTRQGKGALTSSLTRGQTCFWAKKAIRRTLSAMLWIARRRMQPPVRPASSFRVCGTMH
jgi:hypothetical protein